MGRVRTQQGRNALSGFHQRCIFDKKMSRGSSYPVVSVNWLLPSGPLVILNTFGVDGRKTSRDSSSLALRSDTVSLIGTSFSGLAPVTGLTVFKQ